MYEVVPDVAGPQRWQNLGSKQCLFAKVTVGPLPYA